MPGVGAAPLNPSGDDAEDDDTEPAEGIPLLFPSSLDIERRERVCLHQVAEHERRLRMAQLQDSLTELWHTRKIRCKLLVNHHVQVAGQGQRANTHSRAILNNVESRIAKFVEHYRLAYRALLQLDPTGGWQDTYLELKDGDNRGPGKERDEDGVGDGSYFRSWIWLLNPRAPDTADGDAGEEGASDEDVNEVVRVEWTTAFARLERWREEIELLQEEMRRVVMFLEWKSRGWLVKAEAPRGNATPDVESGLNAYARKQAAIYHALAISFAQLWRPTLVSYGLEHSWITNFLTQNGVSLTVSDGPAVSKRGIFKFRIAKSHHAASAAVSSPTIALSSSTIAPSSSTTLPPSSATPPLSAIALPFATPATTGDPPILEEYSDSEDPGDSDTEDGDSDFEDDWGDDLDF